MRRSKEFPYQKDEKQREENNRKNNRRNEY